MTASFAQLGSPTQAFVDAVNTRLKADGALIALVTGVFGHLSQAARTNYPYLVLGYRHLDDGNARAMGNAGGRVALQVDGWSDHKGASEMQAICSRVRALLERQTLTLAGGFRMMAGSLTCEMEDVFDEPDEDKPDQILYHGTMRWVAEIDEAA